MYIVTGNAGQSSSGKWRNCGWMQLQRHVRQSSHLCRLISATDAWLLAVSRKRPMLGKCILQGGFPLDKPCPEQPAAEVEEPSSSWAAVIVGYPSAEGSQMRGVSVDNRLPVTKLIS